MIPGPSSPVGEETFDRYRQELQATEPRHIAENVRAIEPLLFDLKAHLPDDLPRHFLEDNLCRFALAQQLPVVVHRALTDVLVVARQVQRELHGGVKAPRVGRLLHRPVAIFPKKQEPAHGMQFLCGPPNLRVEGLADFHGGHQLQDARAKDPLHPITEPTKSFRCQLCVPPAKLLRVEEAVL